MCERRARGREILDAVKDSGEGAAFARASYRAMERVNRRLGFREAVKEFVASRADALTVSRPLRVLDMGAGDCALAMDILEWAHQKGIRTVFTCVEPNQDALALARERLSDRPDLNIILAGERIEEHTPNQPYDCAVGTLFFHHFGDADILRLLRRLRRFVRGSVLINDLRRGAVPFIAFLLLSPVLPSLVCRDGLLSIRRSFTPRGIRRLLARLADSNVRICEDTPFRVTARVDFQRPELPT